MQCDLPFLKCGKRGHLPLVPDFLLSPAFLPIAAFLFTAVYFITSVNSSMGLSIKGCSYNPTLSIWKYEMQQETAIKTLPPPSGEVSYLIFSVARVAA